MLTLRSHTVGTSIPNTLRTVFTSFVLDEKARHYSSADGATTELIPRYGWHYSSRHSKVPQPRFSIFRILVDVVLEMVLFHAAFVALKARCPLTVKVPSDDYKLAGEKLLFQG